MGDLDKLIEAVEGGKWSGVNIIWSIGEANGRKAWAAYHGSLDAAKALHETLLPGWEWDVSWVGAMVGGPDSKVPERSVNDFFEDNAANPARAWLIAILKAYRAQQESRQ